MDEGEDGDDGANKSKGKRGGSKRKKVEEVLEISMAKKANEDAFFNKWMKQREAKGISLKKRIIGNEKEGTKKIIKKRKVKIEGEEGAEDEDSNANEGAKKKKKSGKATGGTSAGAKNENEGRDDLDNIREGDDIEGDNQGEDGADAN
jgi:hypothetical protein